MYSIASPSPKMLLATEKSFQTKKGYESVLLQISE
jgi:hypothetical protein